jgi:hypothetical protein
LVRTRHYNLKQYNTYGDINTTIAQYNEQYGGRLWSNKATSSFSALQYQPLSSIDATSFIYYGVLGFAATYSSNHDVVGFYGGNNNWRVQRVSATNARLYITDGGGTEISLGPFNIAGTEFPNPYFGLQVSYDNSTGDYAVYVNGLGVLSGTNPLGRSGSGSKFVFGQLSNTQMYHYTSAVWPDDSGSLINSSAMATALSVRYPGII